MHCIYKNINYFFVPSTHPSHFRQFINLKSSYQSVCLIVLMCLCFLQPFLPLSDSGALCDSDESGGSDNEDDDDAFLSDTQMTEHSEPNSYR